MNRVPQATYEEARARTDKIRAGFAEINNLCALLPVESRKGQSDTRSVYFVEAATGLIKIGVATDPDGRLRALRTMSPVSLRLVLTIPGVGAAGEIELHRRFAEHRSHGEWFRPAPELTAFIQEHK